MEVSELVSTSASAVVVGSAVVGLAIAPYRALLSRLKGLAEQIDRLDTSLGAVVNQLVTIDGRLGSLEKRVGSIEGKMDEATGAISSHGERLAFLEGGRARRWKGSGRFNS